jgi:hypothetical protein
MIKLLLLEAMLMLLDWLTFVLRQHLLEPVGLLILSLFSDLSGFLDENGGPAAG